MEVTRSVSFYLRRSCHKTSPRLQKPKSFLFSLYSDVCALVPEAMCLFVFLNVPFFSFFQASEEESGKPFQCPICGLVIKRKSYWKRHMVIHTGLKSHQCPLCPFRCARKDNLKSHMKVSHLPTDLGRGKHHQGACSGSGAGGFLAKRGHYGGAQCQVEVNTDEGCPKGHFAGTVPTVPSRA
jgi:hypothetical protein